MEANDHDPDDHGTGASRLRRTMQKAQARKRTRREEVAREEAKASRRRNDLLPELQVRQIALGQLRPAGRRVHKRDEAQIARVAASLETFGATRPILVTVDMQIIDGHAVFEAATQLGLPSIPCVIVDHLDDVEVRALRIALNRLPERAEWDMEVLTFELRELEIAGGPIEVLGFDAPQLDALLDGGDDEVASEAGPLEPEPDAQTVSHRGWVWLLGRHRLICADATRAETYVRLLGRMHVRIVLTDVPYNVRIAHNVSSRRRREFVQASGELTRPEFAAFNRAWMEACKRWLMDGGLMASFIDWRSVDLLLNTGRELDLELLNLIVWNKTNAGMGALWRSQHELLPVWKAGVGEHVNNVDLGRHGRNRTNVWTYPGASSLGSDARAGLQSHPTVKPVAMLKDMLLDVTQRADAVLDPFTGSGSTLIAAERTGRTFYGVDLDPAYVDVAVRRWQAETGGQAVLEGAGATFDEVAATPELASNASTPLLLEGPRHG